MKKFQVKFIALAMMVWFGAVSVVFGSAFDGIVTFAVNDSFFNVVGSAADRYYNSYDTKCKTWIRFWNHHKGGNNSIPTSCDTGSDHGLSANDCVAKGTSGVICDGNIVGGHVWKKGTPGTYYILPICNNHNVKQGAAKMKATRQETGVKLKNFLIPKE